MSIRENRGALKIPFLLRMQSSGVISIAYSFFFDNRGYGIVLPNIFFEFIFQQLIFTCRKLFLIKILRERASSIYSGI